MTLSASSLFVLSRVSLVLDSGRSVVRISFSHRSGAFILNVIRSGLCFDIRCRLGGTFIVKRSLSFVLVTAKSMQEGWLRDLHCSAPEAWLKLWKQVGSFSLLRSDSFGALLRKVLSNPLQFLSLALPNLLRWMLRSPASRTASEVSKLSKVARRVVHRFLIFCLISSLLTAASSSL